MADLKISELTETTSVTTSNYAPVSAGATTKKYALTNLRPGFISRTMTASGNLAATDCGNLVIADSASAIVLTIPGGGAIASGSAPITVMRKGTGLVSFATGGTMFPAQKFIEQYGSCEIYATAADTFWLKVDNNNHIVQTETVTGTGSIPATYAGKFIIVDSATDVDLTLPDCATVFGYRAPPFIFFMKNTGMPTILAAGSDTIYPTDSYIRNQHGSITVFPISSTEWFAEHDGYAATIWVP